MTRPFLRHTICALPSAGNSHCKIAVSPLVATVLDRDLLKDRAALEAEIVLKVPLLQYQYP